ncbi:MAG: hypothetical protein KatS3mg096_535 [Candidatus Parcubacteria bacterium]|nr:MAG: hypothetical protein KatS3mg096_535 [Candidatus Parcubacteria bacterium]
MDKTINSIIKLTEKIADGESFTASKIINAINCIENSDKNLNVYKGILIVYYFRKYKDFPKKNLNKLKTYSSFEKCLHILRGNILNPTEIANTFLDILKIPDSDGTIRDILMGCFYGALWPFMNNPKNFNIAIEYGLALIESAFSLDNFNIHKKINIINGDQGIKIINMAGSGKKEIKLLNLSSMAAIITAATGKKIRENIVVEKTTSRATSSITGSSDIFELAGVNLNLPIHKMAEISLTTKLGIFDINAIVPRLNHVYDGRLYNVQVFAGLVGGAAIVNPVDADLINYGLTRGSTQLCLAILNRLYPTKNILVLQGKDPHGMPVIDQVSIAANTEVAQIIKNKITIREIAPEDFGFDFIPFKYVETTQNQRENLNEFIKILIGRGDKALKQTVAMEVALNLFGLEVVDNLKTGAALALETINSGLGIKVLEDLVVHSDGDKQRFSSLANI